MIIALKKIGKDAKSKNSLKTKTILLESKNYFTIFTILNIKISINFIQEKNLLVMFLLFLGNTIF